MKETPDVAALDQLMAEDVPPDSRQARQLARRQAIAEAIMAEGSIRIEDIAERFEISLMTAHRDLDDLAGRGLLRKTRGIVSAAPTSLVEASDLYRSYRQSGEKAAIAAAAADLIEPGQALFLDDSTTVLQMAPHLAEKLPLTVITNSLSLMSELKGLPDLTLFGLGGQYHSWCNAFMGRMTVHEISRLRADVLFVSMPAITDGIVFHQSPEMADTKRAMFEAASRRVLLADHTKFDRRALHGMVALADFDAIVTDDLTPQVHLDALQALDLTVVVAKTGQAG
ncbi:DeoR/GlpR family DNA-binding transcription regulator [Pelagovum pacificum]|uniref:DeoR/GlpR transcriptional regulator n=1 Tax=Pelagovum pacificum TaxID=2588711 RepID=A0A5C5GB47_9RHOB|nr:DeoR/GlpR family DNA-binding transcription regulator [Pelagovum pacificum]QQA41427.1 DeoR/GlpR transcriptional regulator [Pelagovum pacificum]TNY31770.1 DeoR/GlpR transcriptional regulator [Pelagovum pacificum]